MRLPAPRRAAAAALVAVLAAFAPMAGAAPDEVDPDLATRDADYAAGKRAIDAKDWAEAVRRFERAKVRHPDQADVHNLLGFSHRNLRQYEPAFAAYRRAIEIDPRHRGAHEYIGETYLAIGDLAGAQKHLDALRAICVLPCEELADLEKAVAQYQAKR